METLLHLTIRNLLHLTTRSLLWFTSIWICKHIPVSVVWWEVHPKQVRLRRGIWDNLLECLKLGWVLCNEGHLSCSCSVILYVIALWGLSLNFTQISMNLVRQARRRQEVGCLLRGRKWLNIQGFWHLLFLLVCMIISPMLFALQQIVGYVYDYNKFKGALCHGLYSKLQYFGGNRLVLG